MIPEFRLVKVTEPYGRWSPTQSTRHQGNTEPFREQQPLLSAVRDEPMALHGLIISHLNVFVKDA